MKYFFLLFILLYPFYPIWGQEQFTSEKNSSIIEEELPPIYLKQIESTLNIFNQKIQQAKDLNPEEISFFEKPENINVFTLLYLNQKDAGLFTGTKGLGQWQYLPIGRFRLVSCNSGIPKNKPLFLALQAEIDSDVILQKPIIPISLSSDIKEEQILYPIQNVFQNKTDSYIGTVFFPLIYQLKNNQGPFSIHKEITLTGCRQKSCQTFTLPLSLTLPAEKSYPTDICSAMMNEFQSTPMPPLGKIRATAITEGAAFIQLIFNFQENIDYINLQADNDFEWHLTQKNINGKNVHLLLETKHPVPEGTLLHLKVLSSAGWYEIATPLEKGSFSTDLPHFSWINAFIAGLMLFFFSPLFILFWSLRPQNQLNLTKQIQKIIAGITGIALFCSFGIYFQLISISFFAIQTIGALIGCIALFYLLIRPKVTPLTAALFFFLLPKPYLNETIAALNDSDILPFQIFALWGFICCIPFFLLRKQVAFFNGLTLAEKQLKTIKRIPLFLLFLWSLFVLLLPLYIPTEESFSFENLEKEIQEDKIVFISIESNRCLSCLMNQIGLRFFYPGEILYNRGKLKIYSLETNTPEGKAFLQKQKMPAHSFGFLYGPRKPYGILINNYISPEKWGDILWRVGNLPNPEQFYMVGEDLTEDILLSPEIKSRMCFPGSEPF